MGGRMTDKPHILTLDIETAPIVAHVWGLFDQNVGINQIQAEWRILSIAWKWLGQRETLFRRAAVTREAVDDSEVAQAAWKLLDAADIVVTQNGNDFDLKKLNARMIELGMKPYSPVRKIDTKLVAKRVFGFTSNRLEWMGKHIAGMPKEVHRKFPGHELWTECLKNNPEAWKEMEKYNVRDVQATEKLYLRMRPWVEGHPNLGTYTGKDHVCPRCGSGRVSRRGVVTTNTNVFQRYHCGSCGGWSRGRVGTSHRSAVARRLVSHP